MILRRRWCLSLSAQFDETFEICNRTSNGGSHHCGGVCRWVVSTFPFNWRRCHRNGGRESCRCCRYRFLFLIKQWSFWGVKVWPDFDKQKFLAAKEWKLPLSLLVSAFSWRATILFHQSFPHTHWNVVYRSCYFSPSPSCLTMTKKMSRCHDEIVAAVHFSSSERTTSFRMYYRRFRCCSHPDHWLLSSTSSCSSLMLPLPSLSRCWRLKSCCAAA